MYCVKFKTCIKVGWFHHKKPNQLCVLVLHSLQLRVCCLIQWMWIHMEIMVQTETGVCHFVCISRKFRRSG